MSVNVEHPSTPVNPTPLKTKGHSSKKKDREPGTEKKRKRHEEGQDSHRKAKERRSVEDTQQEATEKAPTPVRVTESPFCRQTSSFYLPLSPISQLHPLEGLCAEHLSPLLLTYYRPFGGVVISYSNARLSERPTPTSSRTQGPTLAKAINEYAAMFVWVTADFLLFKPRPGQVIEGYINLLNESHLGLVCWNLFNASIERNRLPRDWKWSGVGGDMAGRNGKRNDENIALHSDDEDRGQGTFIDGQGQAVEGMIQFRIIDSETAYSHGKGFLTIEGTLLDDDEEEALLRKEQTIAQGAIPSRGNGQGDGRPEEGNDGEDIAKLYGTQNNEDIDEEEEEDAGTESN